MSSGYKKETQHINWIDFAKVAGIYLVIIGHGKLLSPEWRQYIYSFHMPLFFIISGMLFHVKPKDKFWKNIVRRMIIPYLLINLFFLVVKNLGRVLLIGKWDLSNFLKQIYAILLGVGYKTEYCEPVCTTLWFVIALVILYIIFNISASRKYAVLVTLACIVCFIALSTQGIDIWMPIDSALFAAPFFCFGMFAKEYLLNNNNENKYAMVGGALLLVCYIVNLYNGKVNINGCNYGRSLALFYVAGGTGAMGFLLLCKSISIKKDYSEFAKGLFLIMGFNLLFISLFTFAFNKLFPSINMSSGIGLFVGFLILICFKPIINWCIKYFPAIIGYR